MHEDSLRNYPELMSPEMLAGFLGCSPRHARNLIEDMEYINIGRGKKRRQLRVHKEDVCRRV